MRVGDGYVSGPDAPLEARAVALAAADSARALVMVECVSDQVAVETLALRLGRDLTAERVVVFPIGGAHGITRDLLQFGPMGAGLTLAGLCDAGEETVYRRGLATAGVGTPQNRSEMERLGFFVCVDDLEDELIRAAGEQLITGLLDTHGDLASLETLQKQPAWRNEPFEAQMRRFLGAGARRKIRYAELLVAAVPLDHMPRPLLGVLAQI